jgi:hypothetical protein
MCYCRAWPAEINQVELAVSVTAMHEHHYRKVVVIDSSTVCLQVCFTGLHCQVSWIHGTVSQVYVSEIITTTVKRLIPIRKRY